MVFPTAFLAVAFIAFMVFIGVMAFPTAFVAVAFIAFMVFIGAIVAGQD